MKLQTINPGIERVTPSSRELDVLNGICSGGIKGFFTEPHLHEHYEELGNSARLDLSDLASLLLRLANHSGPCALVVGLGPESIKDAGQTPTEFIRPGVDNINPADPLRLVLNGLAGLYGFGYSSLQGGALITNVMPIEQLETTEGHSGNATKELGLHTEAASARSASADLSPDVLTLQFIRNPNNVPTTISIPDITTLPPDVIDLLSQPRYRILTNPP